MYIFSNIFKPLSLYKFLWKVKLSIYGISCIAIWLQFPTVSVTAKSCRNISNYRYKLVCCALIIFATITTIYEPFRRPCSDSRHITAPYKLALYYLLLLFTRTTLVSWYYILKLTFLNPHYQEMKEISCSNISFVSVYERNLEYNNKVCLLCWLRKSFWSCRLDQTNDNTIKT